MKITPRAIMSLSAVVGLLGANALSASASPLKMEKSPSQQRFVPGEILLSQHPGTDSEDFKNSIKAIDGTISETIASPDGKLTTYVVKVPPSKLNDSLKKAQKDKNFDAVSANLMYHIQYTKTPNDPLFTAAGSYYFSSLHIPKAWSLGAGGGKTIGSIDSGVDYVGNTDLLNKQVNRGVNLVTGAQNGLDVNGHGTFTMTNATALTNNNFGNASAAFLSGIYPIVVTDPQGFASSAAIMKAIKILIGANVKVANLSINANPPNSFSDPTANGAGVRAWADRFYSNGGLLFNAAGNGDDAGNGINDTAAIKSPSLIVVAATSDGGEFGGLDQPASFSNYGPQLYFAAPGVNITNTGVGGSTVTESGTSFSTPLTASVALQVWGVRPSLTNLQVLTIMQSTARHPTGYTQLHYGSGIPSAGAAVNLALTSF